MKLYYILIAVLINFAVLSSNAQDIKDIRVHCVEGYFKTGITVETVISGSKDRNTRGNLYFIRNTYVLAKIEKVIDKFLVESPDSISIYMKSDMRIACIISFGDINKLLAIDSRMRIHYNGKTYIPSERLMKLLHIKRMCSLSKTAKKLIG